MLPGLLRKRPLHTVSTGTPLFRALTALDLTLLGIGAIIGAGVFVLTGVAAATKAGPAIVVSYIIAGLAAMFAAFAYAELAASIGGTGSAYSYAYTSFGELVAWIIGWDLLLEYIMSVTTVAIGWAGYVNNLFQALGIHLPIELVKNPFDGGLINLLAVGIVLLLSILLSLGVKYSARFNFLIVVIKLLTIATFITVAAMNVQPHYWVPFFPFGWEGVMSGAALVFFAYIGFDALSTAVEEALHPQRDVPIGIIVSLVVCTLIYIVVSGLLTGIVPYQILNVASPVSDALLQIGYRTASGVIAAGAIAGLTTVMLVMYYGLTRICLAISRDGLLPVSFAHIHPQTFTPVRIILSTGVVIALIAGFAPIDRAAEMVNIGTLAAFVFVCAGVMVLRYTQKEMHRPFRLPFNPLFPMLGIIFCIYLMVHLPVITWLRFIIWMTAGLIIYFTYSYRHSKLGRAIK